MRRLPLCILFLLLCLAPAWAQTADEKKATVAYLQKLQAGDGGFLAAAPNPLAGRRDVSSLRATTTAVRALKYFGGEPKDKDACAKYVQNAFDEKTGGFIDAQPGLKPDVFATAAGLMAVVELKLPADKYVDPGVKFLGENAKTFEEVRLAAAALEAVGKRPPQADAWLEQIIKMRNPDRTYGKGDGAARDTGGAVVAVLRLGGKVEGEEKGFVVHLLQTGQREDGGFGKADTKGSDLESSYRVMRAFHMLGAKPDAKKVRDFVNKCRNDDGGYGVAPGQASSASGTYFAGIILHWLEEK
jgi:prenyltransferase beta subunit